MAVLAYGLLCFAPAVLFELLARGLHRWAGMSRRPAAFAKRRRRGKKPSAAAAKLFIPPPDTLRFGEDLHRLATTYDKLRITHTPAMASRLRALELAYDDTLRNACVALALEPPPKELDGLTRLQVEAELLTAGLRW